MLLDVTGLAADARAEMEQALRKAIAQVAPGVPVQIMQTAERVSQRLIAIASGKGGVGKSTLSTKSGGRDEAPGSPRWPCRCRHLWSVAAPTIGSTEDTTPVSEDKKLYPVIGEGGVPFLSMGQLAKPGQPIAWCGPGGSGLTQLVDAHWGDVREVVVDMPPGTGDIQLSMVQKHKPVGAVIISTPQDLALMDAARAIGFFNTAKVPIIGLVENPRGLYLPALQRGRAIRLAVAGQRRRQRSWASRFGRFLST